MRLGGSLLHCPAPRRPQAAEIEMRRRQREPYPEILERAKPIEEQRWPGAPRPAPPPPQPAKIEMRRGQREPYPEILERAKPIEEQRWPARPGRHAPAKPRQ